MLPMYNCSINPVDKVMGIYEPLVLAGREKVEYREIVDREIIFFFFYIIEKAQPF